MKDTPEAKNIFPSEGLSLQEHLDLIGMPPKLMAINAHVPEQVLARALVGGSIIEQHANSICRVLTREHGFHAGLAGIQPSDIKGLQVWQPDEQHEKSAFNFDDLRSTDRSSNLW